MVIFESPRFLLGLLFLVIPLLIFVYNILWKKRVFKFLGNSDILKELTQSYSGKLFKLKFLFVLIALVLIVICIANPKIETNRPVTEHDNDFMIVLDVSNSMLADDIQPSRLERAKKLIDSLINNNIHQRFGLITFAGKSFLQVPITSDLSTMSSRLKEVSTDAVPTQGTSIPQALMLADKSLNLPEKRERNIVLISDGENHENNIKAASDTLLRHNIIVHSIGVGTAEGAEIIEEVSGKFKKDENGNIVITKLNSITLKQISSITKGKYFDINSDNLLEMLRSLLYNKSQSSKGKRRMIYELIYPFILFMCISLLVSEIFISEKRNIKRRRMWKYNWVIALLIPTPILGQTSQKVMDLYRQKQFAKAFVLYKKELSKNPNDPLILYNLGNTSFMMGNVTDAIQTFQKSIDKSKDISISAKAHNNLGLTYIKAGNLDKAIESFKAALRLIPNDLECRENLQMALNELNKSQLKNKEKNQQQAESNETLQEKQNDEVSKTNIGELLQLIDKQEKKFRDSIRSSNLIKQTKLKKDW